MTGVQTCALPISNTDYKLRIEEALEVIRQKTGLPIKRLVFGDLHLQDIRKWRINTWADYEVSTPLFNIPYEELLNRLWKFTTEKNLDISLSTEVKLSDSTLPVGTLFDPELVNKLELMGIDRMLENGEGHTLVMPKQIHT